LSSRIYNAYCSDEPSAKNRSIGDRHFDVCWVPPPMSISSWYEQRGFKSKSCLDSQPAIVEPTRSLEFGTFVCALGSSGVSAGVAFITFVSEDEASFSWEGFKWAVASTARSLTLF
jgi:hypothetical protein